MTNETPSGSVDDAPVQIEWPRPGVALLRLNRPDRLNALNPAMVAAIPAALTKVAADRSCRVIVLTGAGRGFCAGLDLQSAVGSELRTGAGSGAASDGLGRGPGHRLVGQERFAAMIHTLRSLRQPVIAAVNGPAAGAGFALALGSDIRIAARSARFHVAAVKIGLSGGECGMSYLLPRYIGAARAFELLLTGRPFDAAEAERIGLVARVVPDDELLDAALAMADTIVANSPLAIWLTKQVVWSNLDASSFESAIELENRTQVLASMSADSAEAMRAFVEKRPAVFTGE
jgi:enoyl-CoA hydratase